MMLEMLLILSVVLNGFLIFYSVRLARRIYVVGTNLEALYSMVYAFRSHVEQVHEAEMFYGDATLKALLDHSREMLEEIDKYEDLMQIVGPEEEEGNATEEE